MKSSKGISTIVAALILVAIVVVASLGIGIWTGAIPLDFGDGAAVPYDGQLAVTITEANLLVRGASVTTTSDKYSFYPSGGAALEDASVDDFLGGEDFVVGTEKTINIEPEDLGTWWLYADPGTDWFMDAAATKAANSEIVGYEKIDVDDDGRDEYVFEVDVSGTKEKLTTPSRTLKMVLIEEDTTPPSLDAPADQTSIGTGSVTDIKIKWELTVAELKGIRIADVYLSTNETIFKEDVIVTSLSILGTSGVTRDNPYWVANMGVNDPYEPLDTKLVMIEENAETEISITVKVTTTFAVADHGVELTLSIVTMGADEAQDTAITDTVILSE